jgi:hypothetical protein
MAVNFQRVMRLMEGHQYQLRERDSDYYRTLEESERLPPLLSGLESLVD